MRQLSNPSQEIESLPDRETLPSQVTVGRPVRQPLYDGTHVAAGRDDHVRVHGH